MIVDSLEQADRYRIIHPRLGDGFAFLEREDLASLADGEYEIDGEAIYAIVARGQGRGRDAALLEAHRDYLEIHYVVSGVDEVGWCHRQACTRVSTPYDATRDVEFYYDLPQLWLPLPPGIFAVLYPHDAHAPFATDSMLHKVVVKVRL